MCVCICVHVCVYSHSTVYGTTQPSGYRRGGRSSLLCEPGATSEFEPPYPTETRKPSSMQLASCFLLLEMAFKILSLLCNLINFNGIKSYRTLGALIHLPTQKHSCN